MAKRQPVMPRFLAKVNKTDSCWLRTARIERNGYGRFWLDGRQRGAHRVSYELHVGPIPAGLVIDHLCRVHACVNPQHLEPVTAAENVRRGVASQATTAKWKSVTHCKRGHEYDTDNTRVDSKGGRVCLSCKRLVAKRHYERNRQTYIDKARAWHLENPERAREHARQSQKRYRDKKKDAA